MKRVREVVVAHVQNGARVLEVGAGAREMERTLIAARREIMYESCDIDPGTRHDYRDLAAIEGPYDIVLALEVIEHLSLEEIGPWLARLHALLAAGGTLILSTPNTYYPPAYLRDATHRTPLCYDELAALVEMAGFSTREIVRIYHDPLHRKLLRRYLLGWLFRAIGIDFARQIVLVAQKPEDQADASAASSDS
ncbi:MAG: methyltransferase domain-containing protein [Pirellulales bacterium]|nr:methyltransferase domain-containing protein [Pirellulales bacterium]